MFEVTGKLSTQKVINKSMIDLLVNDFPSSAESKTFECYDYTYDKTGKKWVAGEEPKKCHALKATAVACNR
jgi:hypothetical protein